MSWYDDNIAGPMGYEHCVLFDCARDAISAYHHVVPAKPLALPENICPELVSHMRRKCHKVLFGEIDQTTGLSDGAVHLYGYQAQGAGVDEAELTIDPLMTGWVRRLRSPSAVISFGLKKMLSMGYGGAFLTNDESLANEMENMGCWNSDYTYFLRTALEDFSKRRILRFETMALWDRYLGDLLSRIPGEQLMPWRVMRRARDWLQRENIKIALRDAGYDVGTNYRPIRGTNRWGDTVLNFFCPPLQEKAEIKGACELIKAVVNNG